MSSYGLNDGEYWPESRDWTTTDERRGNETTAKEVVTLYISDKSGKKLFRVTVTNAFSLGERNNLQKKLDMVKAKHPAYLFIDAETAFIGED